MARCKEDKTLYELLSKVSDEDEKNFELDENALPFLFRAIHSLSPKWSSFCLQLDVPELEKIDTNGTCADDRLVLALQSWLRQETPTWKGLITAIFIPAGGGNQALARKIANSFQELRHIKPSELAQSTAAADICGDDPESVKGAVKELQRVLGNSVVARWYQMGTVLGAPVSDLEMIRLNDRVDVIEKQRMMLEAWLSCIDGNRSWQWLVDSLGHLAGGKHPKVAKKVSELHPRDSVSSDGASVLSSSTHHLALPQATTSVPKVPRRNPPSLVDLVSFQTSEGYKDLAEQVGGTYYRTFGTLLLKDESSAIMDSLEITHNSRVEDINRDVFKRWINTETTPVTWDNFLATLRRSGLQRLAALVESGLSQ